MAFVAPHLVMSDMAILQQLGAGHHTHLRLITYKSGLIVSYSLNQQEDRSLSPRLFCTIWEPSILFT
jgi:hypothetical protein